METYDKWKSARLNIVQERGYVLLPPEVYEDEDIPYAVAYIYVVRPDRPTRDGRSYDCDAIPVMTTDRKNMDEIKTWRQYDIVNVNGVLATRENVIKTCECPNCGTENETEGTFGYVNPISCEFITKMRTANECVHYLHEWNHKEVSNKIIIGGTLTRDPKKRTIKRSGIPVVQYQIAANRLFVIPDDPPDVKTDYPWVKSYGDMGLSDHDRLYKGSLVIIDGCLQNRKRATPCVCSHCGTKFDWADKALEIVPHEVHYMHGFRSDEEIARLKSEKLEQATSDILNNIRKRRGLSDDDDEISEDDILFGFERIDDE